MTKPWADAYQRAIVPGFAEQAIPDGYALRCVNREACAEAFRHVIAEGYAMAAIGLPIARIRAPQDPGEQLAFWLGYVAWFEEGGTK